MKIPKKSTVNKRVAFMAFLFLLIFITLFVRIIYIQYAKEIDGQDLLKLGNDRWTTTEVLEGQRGTIYDRNGSPVAQEVKSYTTIAILDEDYPIHVQDIHETAVKLSPYIDMEVSSLENLLSSGQINGRFQVELGSGATNIGHEKKETIAALNIPGITFVDDSKRYYPKQDFASHLIGYTERDMTKARMGLEHSLNEYLMSEDGYIRYRRDRVGVELPNSIESKKPHKNGYDVYLTIDGNIQAVLEQMMTKIEEEYTPKKMIAIVANPKTGEILGMSNRPSFNPNEYEDIVNYTNYAISSRYEPGSTMKVFTLAAAIEEGVFDAEETYMSGSYAIGGRRIHDHNQGRGWGKITYKEGVQRSSNVAFSKIAIEKLGPEKLYDYIGKFGFRNPTGIDLPNEASGLIAESYTIDAATTAFGQATAITPIQQIQAATAIANNGKMMKPYVIDRIVNSDTGTVLKKSEPEVVGEPISKETAAQVLDILESVVTEPEGTGNAYNIEGLQVAGKTGTAQIPREDGKGYMSGGKNIFSFIGIAPKNDPQVIVYVAIDRPNTPPTEVGSAPVSKIFNTVMKRSVQYVSLANEANTDDVNLTLGFTLPNFEGQSIELVENFLKDKHVSVVRIGTGNSIDVQLPAANVHIFSHDKVMLKTDSDEIPMLDLTGWSLRDVLKFSYLAKLNPNILGTGYVVTQSIEPGTPIQPNETLTIELEPSNPEFQDSVEEESIDGETQEITDENESVDNEGVAINIPQVTDQ